MKGRGIFFIVWGALLYILGNTAQMQRGQIRVALGVLLLVFS